MCGLTGFLSSKPVAYADIVHSMAAQVAHRGPDDTGVWTDPDQGVALAHRRLSIVDLSHAGHQPMLSPDGQYVLVFNGEIYNHQALRKELSGSWIGHSDTETLLRALITWGIEKALTKLNGMFAFALWDRRSQSLTLARDRMGEKPLYYGRSGSSFLFGSELKSLTVHPDWRGDIDRNVLALFMRHNYVPTPWSIYSGIFKLPPAHYVTIADGGRQIGEARCYWSLSDIAESGNRMDAGSAGELTGELESLLLDAVGMRMMADVPLGAFLSGGYDSTVVAAMMQAQSARPIKTFTIGFHEEGYNEATHAQAVAAHLGTDHTELYVTSGDALEVVPKLSTLYDEPFADSSQIPTFLVSQLARQHVTVSLSGDGGDELFCGYNRYLLGYSIWKKLGLLPFPVRKGLSHACNLMPGHTLDALQRKLPSRFRVPNLADRLPKLAEVLAHRSSEDFYRDLVSHHKTPDRLVIGSIEPDTLLNRPEHLPRLPELRERMMYLDMMTYLPDDILTKVDRASMAVGLEARVPLLDHRLVEFAWRVPVEFKCSNGQGKRLLRQVLYKYVPKELMDRPKMGFGVPIDYWLRGPLRGWAEELLAEKRLREEGFFDPLPIRKMWEEHLSGQRRWHYYLWDVLMFQAWLEEWG